MKISTLLKPALLIYELFRVLILALILILQSNNNANFLMMLFATQGILYPLMAVFLCLNSIRFKEYLPLFIAGKSIGIFTLLCWSLLSQQNPVIGNSINEMALVSFDLLALAAILIIRKDVINLTENIVTETKAGDSENDLERRKHNAYHSNSERKRRGWKITRSSKSGNSVRSSRKKRCTRRP
ncbi:MAG: hypothetical protein FWC19_10720 [Treponema sp.]|nr:hypothetical protein [Treponema sp.]